jgi:hypothetical protein
MPRRPDRGAFADKSQYRRPRRPSSPAPPAAERTSAGRSMATRLSPTGPWACRPRRPSAGRWPPFSANAQAGVKTMTTSELTIACGVLVGRKPGAFSDRASRCGASSPPSEPRQPAYPAHEPASSRKRSPSRAAICCGESARTRVAASSNASGMPSSPWQIRSTGPTVESSTSNYPLQYPRWSEAKYLGWSR